MRKSILKWLCRVLVLDAVIAFLVPLFQSFFDPQTTFGFLLHQFFYAVVYSNLIGIPICLTLPVVWTRTLRRSPLARSSIRGIVVLLANLMGCLLAGLVLRSLTGPQYDYWQEFRSSLGISLILSAIATSFISLYEAQQARLKNTAMQLQSKELEHERALKLAMEARLSSLEARIHPHFLFNTINSVSSLIHEDPLRAERILTQLAELLRFSLDVAPGGLVPLSRELQVVEDYLEIEKARFGPRLRYSIHVPEALGETPVPPLSIQTLVENSIKYAVGPRGRGASITVQSRECGGRLRLEVEDDGPGFANQELPAGHGLDNLQERLHALFGESARLEIVSSGGQTVVAIDFPHLVPTAVRLPA